MSDHNTAKAYQNPLIQALGSITCYKALVPVPHSQATEAVMFILNIDDVDFLGADPHSGKPRTHQLVLDACKNLRKQGLVQLEGRGKWALTEDGVVAAQELKEELLKSDTPDEDLQSPQQVLEDPDMTQTQFPTDSHIQGLLAAQAPCLGHYTSHKGSGCAECLVQTECQNVLLTRMSEVAQRYFEAESVPEADPDPIPVLSDDSLSDSAMLLGALELKGAKKIQAFEKSICESCGLEISQGSECYWAKNKVTQEGVLLHQGCKQDLENENSKD